MNSIPAKAETKLPDKMSRAAPDAPRLLLVDDDHLVRRGLATYLSDSGFAVLEASDGVEGLETMRLAQPDIVLCDLRMPGMDGLELLEHAVEEFPEMPFIVVTGQGVMQDAIAALRKGAWDFIAKPITEMPFLEHAIERALEKAILLRENLAYRQRLEQAVESTELKLSANQARLRSVIASFHEAFVLVISDEDRVTAVLGPPQLAERYGLTLDDAKAFEVLNRLEPEHARAVTEAVHHVRATGEVRFCEVPITLDPGDFYLELTISRMLDAEGRMTGVQAFVRDITRRKAAEAEALRLEAQLRQSQKLEAIGALAGGIAHDFNNILSVIIGYTHMAIQDSQGNASVQSALDEVYSAANRAAGLIRQILTFSRRGVAEKAELQVAPIAKEAVKMLRATLPSTVEFEAEIDPQAGAIMGDPTQFNQVVLNLGVNAYHAMRGDEHGRLGIFLTRERLEEERNTETGVLAPGNYVRLRVCDTGCGMDAKTIEHIFEPFFTTKPVGEGTGMGLATVHGIVTDAKGAIAVNAKVGKGTTFDVYIPRLGTGTERGRLPMEAMPSGTGNILFVDDEDKIAGYAAVALERLGYSVTGFSDPLQAVREFRNDPEAFDLVITDHSMPSLTGMELAAEIRMHNAAIPIVVITGQHDQVAYSERHSELGIGAIVQKPLDTLTLAQAVASALKPS